MWHTQSGRSFDYDYLVIATGSRLAPELVPGLAENAHQFYDLPGAKKLRDALAEFKGGRIVLNVNAPHKCPVAPVEMALMLDEFLRERGLGGKFEITYTYPIGRLHALEPLANWMVPEFERRGIKSQNFFNTQAVDGAAKTITSEEGDTLPYDLLITVPPHRGAQVIEDSGLGKMGWVPTNPKTPAPSSPTGWFDVLPPKSVLAKPPSLCSATRPSTCTSRVCSTSRSAEPASRSCSVTSARCSTAASA